MFYVLTTMLWKQDKIKDNEQDIATFIPALAAMASDLVRDLDPQVTNISAS